MNPIVIPAKARIQSVNMFLKSRFKIWVPAFAGMTVCMGLAEPLRAAQVALVYENEVAAKKGTFAIASIIPEGVLVPSQLALKSGGNLLVGPVGNSVYKASLVRLDNELGLAVLKLDEQLSNSDIQTVHQLKSRAVLAFLPQGASTAAEPVLISSASTPVMQGMFSFKINDMPIESGVITMKATALRKSKFELEVIIQSTAAVWAMSAELKSDPKLAFWKQGRHSGLNDVPRPVFVYDHQALFAPLKDGKSVKIPIEAHYIDKGKTYIWSISVKTKQGSFVQTANVKFE